MHMAGVNELTLRGTDMLSWFMVEIFNKSLFLSGFFQIILHP